MSENNLTKLWSDFEEMEAFVEIFRKFRSSKGNVQAHLVIPVDC